MKFQLKALAAALVLAAAIPAHAAVDLPNTGNGSLLLTLIDRTANVSAVFDLGYNYLDFNASAAVGAIGSALNSNITWNLASNADYQAVLNAYTGAGASLANSFFAVTAADNVGTPTLGGQGYLGSYVSQGAAILTNPVITASGQFNVYVNQAANAPVNYLFSNLNSANNGGTVTNSVLGGAVGSSYAGNIYNLNRLNGTGNNVMAAVGATMGFQQVITGANGVAASNQTTLNSLVLNTFTLNNAGTLTYVGAVPEADTWAMMMLGLGFMGFVARRKQQA
jgi:PEP-CTERM motif